MEQATVKVTESAEKQLAYAVSEEVTSDGRAYLVINSDDYSIALFPSQIEDDPDKKCTLKFNARVNLKQSGIVFQTMIKELKDEHGTLIAGQQGKLSNHRAVVTEWNRDTKRSYERMSIPGNIYREIIGLISDFCHKYETK